MIPLTGYTDRLSAAPGEHIAFKVSSEATGPYRASLARVAHADPNPAGPGVKVEDLAHRFSIERPSRVQPVALGSYARVEAAAVLRLAGPLTVAALVWPTLTTRGEQCVVSGFYWRIATSPAVPGVIEVRRAEGGIRAWDAQVGEYYLDGAYGGLWRRNGRPPQQVAAVGFSAQGLFEGSYYRRQPCADDPRAAFIFAGVEDQVIGDFGLSGGGAAGFELDRADAALGTPAGAIVVATSEGHGPSFVVVPEELLSHISTVNGERPSRLLRADMTYAELPGGGAIFAVGSITFCGSLSHNGYDNNVSRILKNVIDRFRGRRP